MLPWWAARVILLLSCSISAPAAQNWCCRKRKIYLCLTQWDTAWLRSHGCAGPLRRFSSPFSDHSLRLVAGQKCWMVCSVCVREEHGCAGPELGPIASLMVAPEEGSWRVDEVGTHPLLLILSSHIYMLVQQAFGPLKLSQCCQQSCISALAISCCQHMPL